MKYFFFFHSAQARARFQTGRITTM